MRKLFFLLLAIGSITANAQDVSGTAKNAEGAGLAGATISIIKAKDSSVIKFGVSKENGSYSFATVPAGEYRISASHVGYAPVITPAFTVAGANVTAPDVQLAKTSGGNLQGVVVTATKPMVEVKADKMIVNVEGTINAVGSDALELLRKSPGVQVDKDDNLSLSGKNGVQVYIDGRPTPLGGQDLANYLRSLQSANIESIELITNPSAKYEAAGNAGIINIRLKKNKSLGTNGSVNAGYNIGTFPKYNAGFTLNHRNKNTNIFGNYNYNDAKNITDLSIIRTVADSLFDNKGNMTMTNRSHNFKFGADYFINKMSTVGVVVNGTLSDGDISNYSRTPISYLPTKTVDRILVADNKSAANRDNINVNANYSYTNPNGKSLTLNADYGDYDNYTDQLQPNTYFDAKGENVTSKVVYQFVAPSKIKITSAKADWEQNFAKGKLGFGGKTAFIKSDNDFQRYNVFTTSKELDKDRSNQFLYKENINALYANYNRQYKGINLQAGVRMEHTNTDGTSTGLKKSNGNYTPYDSTFTRSYTDFFPSAAITFNKNPMSQWNFTYSMRIDRPVYQDLNPFEFKLDEYTFQKGNINLRPQYTNSFALTHTYKYRLNTKINYSHVKDMFVQWIDTAEGSKSFITKRNLATQDIVSLNISYPFQYKSFSTFANVNTNVSHYTANFEDRKVDLTAFGFSFFSQNSLKFAKTFTAELTGFYNAPTLFQGSFRSRTLWSIDAGLQKQIMKGNATIKASVSDVFNTLRFTGTTDFAGQKSTFVADWESRQFKLAFSFRFGNNAVKAARQRNNSSEEETKRAAQSSGGMGINQ